MAAVVSVQKHTITLGAGQSSNSASLTGSPVVANCIPFVSARITTAASTVDDIPHYAVRAEFSGSTIVVDTGSSATRAMTVEVTVVEFNSSEIRVRSAAYTMDSSTASHAPSLAETIDTGATFLYHTWKCSGTHADGFDHYLVRGELSTTNATFTRESGTTVSVDGRYFTAEAIGGTAYWTVKPVSVSLVDVTSNTGTISPDVDDLTQTFLIGSHSATESGDNSDAATVDAEITDVSTITVSRKIGNEDINGRYFVVEFKAAAADAVQRGTFTITTAATNHSTDITALTEADSMVHPSGASGSFTSGAYTGTSGTAVPDGWSAVSFVDSDTIEMRHLQNAGLDPYDLTWEVIEWDVDGGGEPTRRVLVRG